MEVDLECICELCPLRHMPTVRPFQLVPSRLVPSVVIFVQWNLAHRDSCSQDFNNGFRLVCLGSRTILCGLFVVVLNWGVEDESPDAWCQVLDRWATSVALELDSLLFPRPSVPWGAVGPRLDALPVSSDWKSAFLLSLHGRGSSSLYIHLVFLGMISD